MVTSLNINEKNINITGFPYDMEVIKNKNSFIERYNPLYSYFYEKLWDVINPGESGDIFVLTDLKNNKKELRKIIKKLSQSEIINLDLDECSYESLLEKFYDNFYIIGWVFDFACEEFNFHHPMSFRDDENQFEIE